MQQSRDDTILSQQYYPAVICCGIMYTYERALRDFIHTRFYLSDKLFLFFGCVTYLRTKVLRVSLPAFVRSHCQRTSFLPVRSSIARNEKPVDCSYAGRTSHLSKSQNIRRVRHCVVDSAGLLLSVLVYTRCRAIMSPDLARLFCRTSVSRDVLLISVHVPMPSISPKRKEEGKEIGSSRVWN